MNNFYFGDFIMKRLLLLFMALLPLLLPGEAIPDSWPGA